MTLIQSMTPFEALRDTTITDTGTIVIRITPEHALWNPFKVGDQYLDLSVLKTSDEVRRAFRTNLEYKLQIGVEPVIDALNHIAEHDVILIGSKDNTQVIEEIINDYRDSA